MSTSRRQFLRKAWGAIAIVPILSRCTYDTLPPILEVLSPIGGESLVPHTTHAIRWKAVGAGSLLIELSADGAKSWTNIAEQVPPEPEFFEWKVPKVQSDNCRIRISDMQNSELQDESDAFFGIQSVLRLTYPNGGESLMPGTKENIRWEAAGVGTLLIELSINAGAFWTKIAENVPAEKGFYEWTLPGRNSTQCLIRLTETANPSLRDESDAFFNIFESYTIELSEHPELRQPEGFKVFVNVAFIDFAVVAISETVFRIMSLACTHAGCQVQWIGTIFECPCHGSTFDKKGCVLRGPAVMPLWVYEYELNAAKDTLTVFNRIKPANC